MDQPLYSKNGSTLLIPDTYGNWLSALTFGWFPYLGVKFVREKPDINFLVRIIKNIITYNQDQQIPENYNSLIALSQEEIIWLMEELLPFLEQSPELINERAFYQQYPKP